MQLCIRAIEVVLGKGGKNEVKEFTGMWPLKPNFNLEETTKSFLLNSLSAAPHR
jgi:hypothetical protein